MCVNFWIRGLGYLPSRKTVGMKRQSVYRIRSEPEKQIGSAAARGITETSRNSSPSKAVLLDSIEAAF